MQFRTTIQPLKDQTPIGHNEPVLMLGSCFTQEVGSLLLRDGFNVVVNPMGALYNPASIARVVNRALSGIQYHSGDLILHDGVYHCLDFPSTYQSTDSQILLQRINSDFDILINAVNECKTWIITLGTSYVFELADGTVAGNCHKLPASMFTRRRLTIDEIKDLWQPLVQHRRVIFTVSPIRHMADGLHGNQLSKATLHLGIDALDDAEYFPAFEALLDDLRDYRFYDADMKHPTTVAVEYIYNLFSDTYFTDFTLQQATKCRKDALRAAHRPIITT